MKTVSQIVAIVFVIVGALVMLLGVFELGRAVTNPPSALSFFGTPDLSPLLLGARLLAGGWLSLQGIMLAAFGLALWLLAEIADATRRIASEDTAVQKPTE